MNVTLAGLSGLRGKSPSQHSRNLGSKVQRFAISVTLALPILASAALPASAYSMISASGAVGPMLTSNPMWECVSWAHEVENFNIAVGRTSRYASSTQTIKMWTRLDYSGNNRDWYIKQWYGPQVVTTLPGQYAPFTGVTFSQLPQGYYYRLILVFRWVVNGTVVGEVVSTYNEADRYSDGGVYPSSSFGIDNCYLAWTS